VNRSKREVGETYIFLAISTVPRSRRGKKIGSLTEFGKQKKNETPTGTNGLRKKHLQKKPSKGLRLSYVKKRGVSLC